jgi:hypothetical protein
MPDISSTRGADEIDKPGQKRRRQSVVADQASLFLVANWLTSVVNLPNLHRS